MKHECKLCKFAAECKEDLEKHIVDNHVFPCKTCPSLFFQSMDLLLVHSNNYHEQNLNRKMIKCRKCEKGPMMNDEIKKHDCNEHKVELPVECDQCDFKGESTSDIVSHVISCHKNNPELIHCKHCDYKTMSVENLKDHIECVILKSNLIDRAKI